MVAERASFLEKLHMPGVDDVVAAGTKTLSCGLPFMPAATGPGQTLCQGPSPPNDATLTDFPLSLRTESRMNSAATLRPGFGFRITCGAVAPSLANMSVSITPDSTAPPHPAGDSCASAGQAFNHMPGRTQ